MPDPAGVSGGSWNGSTRDLGRWQIPLKNPPQLGPEIGWQWFKPGQIGVRDAPGWFLERLHEIDPRLTCIWHPVRERWVVWFRDQERWRMILPWGNPYRDWAYLPLDERLLANVWDRCGRIWGSGLKYWQRIEDEILRDKAKKEQVRQQECRDIAGDYYDYRQIKNIGSGSKFAESQS